MEAKFGPLEERIKKFASIEMKFFRKQPGTPFLTTNGMKKFLQELKVESADEKLRR
jgi:hypothetical protein